jgi:hypothetical protein
MKKLVTNKKYLKSPNTCISKECRSNDIEGGFVAIEGISAAQQVKCNRCGKEWVDMYKLQRYELLSD